MSVAVSDDGGLLGPAPASTERWQHLAQAVLGHEGAEGRLDLAFVDEEHMAGLNRDHMGHDGPTDVLAFPLDGAGDEPPAGGSEVPVLLGDVVICPAVARANAADHGVGVDDELALLVVHGVLHVLGWDHATDDERQAMQARERLHLERWRSTEATPSEATPT